MDETQVSIEAWKHSLDALIALGDGFTSEQWSAPTECPEWTVKDIYSHLVGGEEWMSQGHPAPTEGLATIAGRPVAQRRDSDPRSVLGELRQVYALRCEQLVTDPPDPAEPAMTAYGARVSVGILLGHRAFDAWVHEQDVRRAVGAPGGLDAPAASIAAMIFVSSLPRVVAKLAGAPAGAMVRLNVRGPVSFDDMITVDDAGRGHLHRGEGAGSGSADGAEPTVGLTMDWESFARLAAGRISAADAHITVTGDHDLGARILSHFAVTP
jgi:uncharacterized protein (TIGR03083 family)